MYVYIDTKDPDCTFVKQNNHKWLEVDTSRLERNKFLITVGTSKYWINARNVTDIIGDARLGRNLCTSCEVTYLYGDMCPNCKHIGDSTTLNGKGLQTGSIKDFVRSAILRALPIQTVLTGEEY